MEHDYKTNLYKCIEFDKIILNIYIMKIFLAYLLLLIPLSASSEETIPNLKGKWLGINKTISESKGLKTWEKKVEIIEQTDRRFKGSFTYTDGSKNFYGVIHPDNVTFTWIAPNSRGYNFGKILSPNMISACYVEPGIDSTAGCATLKKD